MKNNLCVWATMLIFLALSLDHCGAGTPAAQLTPANASERGEGNAGEDLYPGWERYANTEYEFAFRYPPTWALEEEANLVRLKRGTLLLTVAFHRPDEQAPSAGSGMPAGEIKRRGTIKFLGQEVEKKALVYEGKVKALTYNAQIGNLVLDIRCEDMVGADYRVVDISEAMQHEVDQIVGSFDATFASQTCVAPAARLSRTHATMVTIRDEEAQLWKDKGMQEF